MKKLKQILSLLLLFALLFTIVACNNDNNDGNEGNGESGNGSSNNDDVPENIKSYSKLLQNVLTNDEFNDIIYKHQTSQISDEALTRCIHPYGFLESKGHDIASIKNGSLECYTNTFFKSSEPKNLYMMVAVETSGSYYSNYMLKYSLSEKDW